MTGKEKRIGAFRAIPSFRFEGDAFAGAMELIVAPVIGISELSETEIVLMMKREKLKICGKCLEVSIFERNTVEVTGNIITIERSSPKGGKRAKI